METSGKRKPTGHTYKNPRPETLAEADKAYAAGGIAEDDPNVPEEILYHARPWAIG